MLFGTTCCCANSPVHSSTARCPSKNDDKIDVFNLRALFFLVNAQTAIPSTMLTRVEGPGKQANHLRFVTTGPGKELLMELNDWGGWRRWKMTPDKFSFVLAQIELKRRAGLPITAEEGALVPSLRCVRKMYGEKWDEVQQHHRSRAAAEAAASGTINAPPIYTPNVAVGNQQIPYQILVQYPDDAHADDAHA
jgi:hypothetical protein